MIYVLELPEQAAPRAWFAFDHADFARKVYAADSRPEWEIHDVASVRELLAMRAATPDSTAADGLFPALRRLGGSLGWDTPLHRAAALRQRVGRCQVYWNETEAGIALEDGSLQDGSRRGWQAYRELRGQLIATEALEGLQD
ncbi:hypothetical protein ACLB1G_04525 [Oxalobacteraceae bacterium A2-2]